MLYLDYAADTPASETVLAAFCAAAREYGANPNATHPLGLAAQQALAQATAGIAACLDAAPEEIVLTSGATEANNLAILGLAHAYAGRGRHLITTPLEHASVNGPMMALKAEGYEVDFAGVRPDGRVDVTHLQSLLRPDTLLVSLCAVDSEMGAVQPLGAVRDAVASFPGCRLHVDATQAVGKLALDWRRADLVTLSPHKFYGLTGSGVLVVRGGVRLAPLWHGGAGATSYRSGTPAVGLAAAAEVALTEAFANQAERYQAVSRLAGILCEALAALPYVTLNRPAEASPFLVNFSVRGVRALDVIAQLSQAGICVSSKSACCAPAAPSHPVLAMTGDRKRALNTVRVSLSHRTDDRDLAQFLTALNACVSRLEASCEHQPTH